MHARKCQNQVLTCICTLFRAVHLDPESPCWLLWISIRLDFTSSFQELFCSYSKVLLCFRAYQSLSTFKGRKAWIPHHFLFRLRLCPERRFVMTLGYHSSSIISTFYGSFAFTPFCFLQQASVLSSARREELRRMQEESEKLKANPLLWLVSPHVKVSAFIVLRFFYSITI